MSENASARAQFVCVCVCVRACVRACVCVREREREGGGREGEVNAGRREVDCAQRKREGVLELMVY